jgi:hypothetical protein
MSKLNISSGWLLGVILLNTLTVSNTAWSQTTLGNLEDQIRQRVKQQSPSTPSGAKPVSTTEEENKEPGYLGLMADDRKDRGRGVRVLDVAADGPAAKGGLKKQDLITVIADVRIRQMSDMSDVLNLYGAGETVDLDVLRDNKPLKLKVTLGNRPPQKPAAGQPSESIPSPSGEVISKEPQETKKTSILELFKSKSANSSEKKSIQTPDGEQPEPQLPKNASETSPIIEQLQDRMENMQKRIDELERRVKELEQNMEERRLIGDRG